MSWLLHDPKDRWHGMKFDLAEGSGQFGHSAVFGASGDFRRPHRKIDS
jgi:hypothetical protein